MKNEQNNDRTNKSRERWASLAYKYNCTSIIIMYDERLTFEADKSRQQSKRSAVIYNICNKYSIKIQFMHENANEARLTDYELYSI